MSLRLARLAVALMSSGISRNFHGQSSPKPSIPPRRSASALRVGAAKSCAFYGLGAPSVLSGSPSHSGVVVSSAPPTGTSSRWGGLRFLIWFSLLRIFRFALVASPLGGIARALAPPPDSAHSFPNKAKQFNAVVGGSPPTKKYLLTIKSPQ